MPPSNDVPVEMTEAAPRANLPIPRNSGRLIIDIQEVENPDLTPVTIAATDNGSAAAEERFTLYPPDRPARFAIRISPDATLLRLSLLPSGAAGASRVVIRAAARPATQNGN